MQGAVLFLSGPAGDVRALGAALAERGLGLHPVESAAEAAAEAGSGRFIAHVVDLNLPEGPVMQLVSQLLEKRPEVPTIVLTSEKRMDLAAEAIRRGARDFLTGPFDAERVARAVLAAVSDTRDPASGAAPAHAALIDGFVGSSPATAQLRDRLAAAARSLSPVFLTGESGSGKGLCARTIHRLSPLRDAPIIPIACGGAGSDILADIRSVPRGTVFLDEICDATPAQQKQILDLIRGDPAAADGAEKVQHLRLIASTRRDPLVALRDGTLREDLFYRLYVLPIQVPPLRERNGDVILIAEEMLQRFSEREGRHFTGLAPEVKDLFRRLYWPGNVRQLMNLLCGVVVMHDGPLVTRAMIPSNLTSGAERQVDRDDPLAILDGKTLAEIERLVIETAIRRHQGSVTRAARTLAVAPSTLYRKIEGWTAADRRRGSG